MDSPGGPLGGPWPDLAPPPEAVHLFHSYEDLKAQLMPLQASPQQQSAPGESAFPTDSLCGAESLLREPPRAAGAAHPSQESRSLLQPFSKSFSLNRGTAVAPCAPVTGGLSAAVFRRNEGPPSKDGSSLAAPSTLSLPDGPPVPSQETEEAQGASGPLQRKGNWTKRAPSSPRHTQSSSFPITTRVDRDALTAQRRVRSSEAVGSPVCLVKSRGRREDAQGMGVQQAGSSDFQYVVPPEVESLLMRLQHRSCSTGTAAPFSWRRARERARAVAAAARSSSSNCVEAEGKWKFDGDMLVPGDTEKTKALRQQALDRVRQRAREAREREQQQLLQQQLEQEEQHQRSQELSKQLRQRTLQRIRENAIKQEEERHQQELLQQQMMREAEAQRQYCARHRKALQQRLLQQQHEIKEKIRIHAEESVRQSRDSKARGRAFAYLISILRMSI
ncbi:hypothetical protein, conserved [Eimeria brunetti]|uniref:Uncharacterized protein n=1 Tax=Eimeria brunetti TaxID=51314 RepID=U6LRU4_9EIME|nr:hypothetical protein, conserved [Eimeria brunetti]